MNERQWPPNQTCGEWLSALNRLIPPTGVMLVGAGPGTSRWIQNLRENAVSPVALVEGNTEYCNQLRHRTSPLLGWNILNEVAIPDQAGHTFYLANNPHESGLLEPETLRELWPNLQTAASRTISAGKTLVELEHQAAIACNWLIIDCFPAGAFLRGAEHWLQGIDVLLVRAIQDVRIDMASLPAIDTLMQQAGLRCIHIEPDLHPQITHTLYVRDWQQQRARLQQLKEQQEKYSSSASLAQQQITLLNQCNEQMANLLTQRETEISLLTQRSEQSLLELKQIQDQCENLKENLHLAKQEADRNRISSEQNQQLYNEKLNEQQAVIAALTIGQDKLLDKQGCLIELQRESFKDFSGLIKMELDKKLNNAMHQLESFISIQQFIAGNDMISGFHGWPISPDLGLLLIEKLQDQDYDAIIEFGSGTSTLLMSKALRINQAKNRNKKHTPSTQLTKKIWAFEHDTTYLNKTENLLSTAETGYLVNINLTPLKEWKDESGDYLFYDCQSKLLELMNSFKGEKKRILALIDGPPGASCKNARYPAIPIIYQIFGEHQIDIILDDANRQEEKNAINLWRKYWGNNNINIQEEIFKSEKGIFLASNQK